MSSKYPWFITEAQGESLWDSENCYDVVMGTKRTIQNGYNLRYLQ